ncbi:MAG: hypothetical protein IJN92_09925 [Lachnospiraceae bacterium]|nr:hypothetical protein [Lachnospiraceae bacterium]
MRKQILFALTAATVLTTTASPLLVQASSQKVACETFQKNGCVVVAGKVITNQTELKEVLSKLEQGIGCGNLIDCFPNISCPDTELPGNGTVDENKPETNVPENSKPETEKPDNNNSENSKPETDNSGTNTDTPGTNESVTSNFAKQVVKLVNEERVKAGLKELTIDTQVETAALVRAKEIKQSFSHTRPNGSSFSTVLKEQGVKYKGSGENIAWGQKTPEEVMKGWMNSEGHRANILNAKYTKIGVGNYQDENGRNYWVQLFIY